MTVDEHCGAGQKAGIHAHAVAGVDLDEDEAVPAVTQSFLRGTKTAKKTLLELQDVLHIFIRDQRVTGSDGAFGEEHILKVVFRRRQNAGALIDLSGVKQIEHGEMLHLEDFVHAL